MTNQSGVIKTNLELYRVVMGGSGGYRKLPGGSDDFLLQTDKQTLHHYIYIIIIIFEPLSAAWVEDLLVGVLDLHPGAVEVDPAGVEVAHLVAGEHL